MSELPGYTLCDADADLWECGVNYAMRPIVGKCNRCGVLAQLARKGSWCDECRRKARRHSGCACETDAAKASRAAPGMPCVPGAAMPRLNCKGGRGSRSLGIARSSVALSLWYIERDRAGGTHLVDRGREGTRRCMGQRSLCGAATLAQVASDGTPSCPKCYSMAPYPMPHPWTEPSLRRARRRGK